jgi:hypothetical protein
LTWTYTSPLTSTRDAVRFNIGDTQSADPQLSDEEIDYVLTLRSSVVQAAIMCCDELIARYTRQVTQSVGSVSVSFSDRIGHYKELIARLNLRGAAIEPFIGGQSISDSDSVNTDTDRNGAIFSVGMFDRKY